VAKKIKAKCIISDLIESRLEKAKVLGADRTINVGTENVKDIIMKETNNEGVPVVIDAVCTTKSFEDAFNYVASAGRIVVLGLNKKPSQIAQMHIMVKELDVRGSRLHNNKFPQVTAWFNNREIVAKDMISHVFHFTDIHKAIELIEDKNIENQKVILKFYE
jgi:L-gulonate 5-dehydrogenase